MKRIASLILIAFYFNCLQLSAISFKVESFVQGDIVKKELQYGLYDSDQHPYAGKSDFRVMSISADSGDYMFLRCKDPGCPSPSGYRNILPGEGRFYIDSDNLPEIYNDYLVHVYGECKFGGVDNIQYKFYKMMNKIPTHKQKDKSPPYTDDKITVYIENADDKSSMNETCAYMIYSKKSKGGKYKKNGTVHILKFGQVSQRTIPLNSHIYLKKGWGCSVNALGSGKSVEVYKLKNHTPLLRYGRDHNFNLYYPCSSTTSSPVCSNRGAAGL